MESSIKGEKIQAMKKYKRATFVYNFVLYSLTSLITFLFSFYPFWFPSMKHFLCSLPNMSFYSSPNFFFIVLNVIIFILIGESKLKPSSHSSPDSDIYDEYVARIRSTYHNVNSQEKIHGFMRSPSIEKHISAEKIEKPHDYEEKKKLLRVCKSTIPHEEKKKEMRVSKSEVWGESGNVNREKTKGKKEEQLYLTREELNKRVEAFIARVNKQRLLEAKLVDHSRG